MKAEFYLVMCLSVRMTICRAYIPKVKVGGILVCFFTWSTRRAKKTQKMNRHMALLTPAMLSSLVIALAVGHINTPPKPQLADPEGSASITLYRYEGAGAATCQGTPYNATTYPTRTCRNGTMWACHSGHQCISMQIYSSLDCSGSLTEQTGQVCDVCMGSGSVFLKYTGCSSGSLALNSCSDAGCTSCISAPLTSGCQDGIDYSVVSCSAVTMRYYHDEACGSSVSLYTTAPGGFCNAGTYWQCN